MIVIAILVRQHPPRAPTTASAIRADTGPSRCHRFLPIRAPLVLRQLPLAFYRHRGPLHRLVDASIDPTGNQHRIGHAPIALMTAPGLFKSA